MRTRHHALLFMSMVLVLLAGVFPALAQGGGTITLGQVVSGEITSENPRVSYAFSGQAGDIITISMTATGGGLDSYLELRSPLGNPLYMDDDSGGNLNSLLGPYTLAETGMYTIVATRCCGEGTGGSVGTYNLVVNQAQVTMFAVGETVSVDLTDIQSTVFLQMPGGTGTSAMSLVSRVIEGSTAVIIEVRDPNGVWVNQLTHNNSVSVNLDPLLLPVAGNYLFTVRRDPNIAGPHTPTHLSLEVKPLEIVPLTVGDSVSGLLDDNNPTDYYSFDGTSSDLLRLTGQQSADGQPFDVAVYDPNGYNINGGSTSYFDPSGKTGSFTIDPLQLPVDGTFLLGLRRSDLTGMGATGSSTYVVILEHSQIPALQPGVEVTGRIDQNTTQTVYRLNGVAGQTVKITLRSINEAYAPNMNVQGPNVPAVESASIGGGGGGGGGFFMNVSGGTPGTVTYETTFPATGVYLFWVYNGMYVPDQPAEFGLLVTTGS